jgi:hypothetical protein
LRLRFLSELVRRQSISTKLGRAKRKIVQEDVAAGIDFPDVNGIHVQIIPPARA